MVKCTDAGGTGTAELRGRFFPLNLRRFLELLPLGASVGPCLPSSWLCWLRCHMHHLIFLNFSTPREQWNTKHQHIYRLNTGFCWVFDEGAEWSTAFFYFILLQHLQVEDTGVKPFNHEFSAQQKPQRGWLNLTLCLSWGEFVCPISFACPGSNDSRKFPGTVAGTKTQKMLSG